MSLTGSHPCHLQPNSRTTSKATSHDEACSNSPHACLGLQVGLTKILLKWSPEFTLFGLLYNYLKKIQLTLLQNCLSWCVSATNQITHIIMASKASTTGSFYININSGFSSARGWGNGGGRRPGQGYGHGQGSWGHGSGGYGSWGHGSWGHGSEESEEQVSSSDWLAAFISEGLVPSKIATAPPVGLSTTWCSSGLDLTPTMASVDSG